MNAILIQHQDNIADLCRSYGFQKLEIFDSAATGQFDAATSDFDFIAEFSDVTPGLARRYLAFLEGLLAWSIHKQDRPAPFPVLIPQSHMLPCIRIGRIKRHQWRGYQLMSERRHSWRLSSLLMTRDIRCWLRQDQAPSITRLPAGVVASPFMATCPRSS